MHSETFAPSCRSHFPFTDRGGDRGMAFSDFMVALTQGRLSGCLTRFFPAEELFIGEAIRYTDRKPSVIPGWNSDSPPALGNLVLRLPCAEDRC